MKLTPEAYELVRIGRDEIADELRRIEAGEQRSNVLDEVTLRRMLDCLERELAEHRRQLH